METDVKLMVHTAKTVYISHKTASYAIFCYNSVGDLFVNSDCGFFGYAWRSYGDNFQSFLAQTNADYIVTKFEINHKEVSGKNMPKHRKDNLLILVAEFIAALKKLPNG